MQFEKNKSRLMTLLGLVLGLFDGSPPVEASILRDIADQADQKFQSCDKGDWPRFGGGGSGGTCA